MDTSVVVAKVWNIISFCSLKKYVVNIINCKHTSKYLWCNAKQLQKVPDTLLYAHNILSNSNDTPVHLTS